MLRALRNWEGDEKGKKPMSLVHCLRKASTKHGEQLFLLLLSVTTTHMLRARSFYDTQESKTVDGDMGIEAFP